MEQDITNQISSIKIVSRSFKNDAGENVNYRQLVVTGVLNGNQKEVVLKGISGDTIQLVEAFTPSDSSPIA